MHYIVYHKFNESTDCPDGIMSSAVVLLHLKKQGIELSDISILGDHYRDEKEYPEYPEGDRYLFASGDTMTMVDFSVPGSWLKYWESKGVDVTVIDHHEAKFKMLSEFSKAILDKDECGATLTWRHFFPGVELPELLIHVRRRDIGLDGYYQEQQRYSEAVNEGLSEARSGFRDKFLSVLSEATEALSESGFPGLKEMLPELINSEEFKTSQQFFLVNFLTKMLDENDPEVVKGFAESGEKLLVERDRLIDEVLENKVCDHYLLGHTVKYIKLNKEESRFVSIVGSCASRLHNAPIVWLETEDGNQHLRSATGFNTQPFARLLGGNGHPAASGFRYAPKTHLLLTGSDEICRLVVASDGDGWCVELIANTGRDYKLGDAVALVDEHHCAKLAWVSMIASVPEQGTILLVLSTTPFDRDSSRGFLFLESPGFSVD